MLFGNSVRVHWSLIDIFFYAYWLYANWISKDRLMILKIRHLGLYIIQIFIKKKALVSILCIDCIPICIVFLLISDAIFARSKSSFIQWSMILEEIFVIAINPKDLGVSPPFFLTAAKTWHWICLIYSLACFLTALFGF